MMMMMMMRRRRRAMEGWVRMYCYVDAEVVIIV